jgi:beta-glucanase (GH16 family)
MHLCNIVNVKSVHMFLIKSVTPFLLFVLIFSSCKKETDPTPPDPEFIPSPFGDTGISYSAKAVCDYNLDEAALLNSGYTKSFEDNFDSDLSKWNIWTAGAYNNELQYYQGANLQLSGGILSIVAKKENVNGEANPTDKTQKSFKFTSGRIESKTEFSANVTTPKIRIAARIKLPSGFGMTSGFISAGTNWPTQGQIDMIIGYGQDPTRYTTNYYYGTRSPQNIVQSAFGFITADLDLTACYHVYEMEWTKDALTYYLDGKQVERKTTGGHVQDLFDKKQRLSLYQAVSSDFLTRAKIQTGTMYVDWIKVFTGK